MKKNLRSLTLSVWLTTGLALVVWTTGTIPVVGQQTMIGQELSAPVRVSFEPPASVYPTPNSGYAAQNVQVRQRNSSSSKIRFAFSKKNSDQPQGVRTAPVTPIKLHPNQIAAKRRQLGKTGNAKQTASIPYRSPLLTNSISMQTIPIPPQAVRIPERQPVNTAQSGFNSNQAPVHQQPAQVRQQRVTQTPQVLAEAMTSGQYDGYLVVSDQEFMLMKQGQTPRIDPNRVRSFANRENVMYSPTAVANTGNALNSPVAEYGNMLDRMEFSLAKLPGSPRAVPLPPPSSASVWSRFLTGRQSDEIRAWKNNYVELVQNRAMVPSKQQFDGVPALSDTMIAKGEPVKPIEMKRLKTDIPRAHDEIRLVSGEMTRERSPESHTPKPLRIEDDKQQNVRPVETQPDPEETMSGGKMKVYRPED